ncbi:MAG: type I restriction endonuclease subunit R, partial [Pedobacter sp.]
MATGTKESHFEEHIEKYLTRNIAPNFIEYQVKDSSSYNKDLCIVSEDLIDFIKDTQLDKYNALISEFGDKIDEKIAYYASTALKNSKHKTLDYFRTKLKIRGQHFDPVYFKPTHGKSPEQQIGYAANRLTLVRQLKYSKKNENSIDIVLFVNGFPIVTIELKNALTGQYLQNAIQQYIQDRDPKEPLLEFKRCLVHFAVSTEQVSMCTELKGKSTFFLPFNKSLINENEDGYATSYLWEDVLTKESILDLIQNYVNIQVDKEKYYDPQTKALKEKEKIKLIFPRFHQRRAVKRLLSAIKEEGVGGKYLIQHSA